MTRLQLANYANVSLYGAMVVLALAMLAFAVYVAFGDRPQLRAAAARRTATRQGAASAASVEALVPVGAVGAAAASDAGARRGGGVAAEPDDAARPGPAGAKAGVPSEVPIVGVPSSDRGAAAGRGGRAGRLGLTLTWLSLMLLVVSVLCRGAAVSRVPVANMFEFAVFGSMLVLAVFLGMALRWPIRWLGLFVVAPVLLVLGLALAVWYSPAAELLPSLRSLWLAIHVPIATLSVAVFTIAFSVLLLQLVKERRETRLGRGESARSFVDTLPAAATLDRIAYSLHIVAFPLWTFSLIAGAIWAQQAWGAYWNWDPKETWTFVIWVVYAAYLHARATSGWSRRTANLLAVAGYVAIIINFAVVNVYFVGQHSYSGL